MFKVLVCGGRDYTNKAAVWAVLDVLYTLHNGLEVISGMAKGPDTFAAEWAEKHKLPLHQFYPDWDGPAGRGAGYARNSKMLKEGAPDLVVAFPGGAGTAHMVRITKAKGDVPYVEIT